MYNRCVSQLRDKGFIRELTVASWNSEIRGPCTRVDVTEGSQLSPHILTSRRHWRQPIVTPYFDVFPIPHPPFSSLPNNLPPFQITFPSIGSTMPFFSIHNGTIWKKTEIWKLYRTRNFYCATTSKFVLLRELHWKVPTPWNPYQIKDKWNSKKKKKSIYINATPFKFLLLTYQRIK